MNARSGGAAPTSLAGSFGRPQEYAPAGTVSPDRSEVGVGRPAVFGLVAVAVIGVLYPAVASDAGNPLAAFVLAPLGVAVVGTQRDTGVVAVAAFAVAFVEGWAGELMGVPLGVRLLIVALGGALATFGAAVRSHREQEVVDLEVQRAVLTAFQEGLVPVPAPPQGILAVSPLPAR